MLSELSARSDLENPILPGLLNDMVTISVTYDPRSASPFNPLYDAVNNTNTTPPGLVLRLLFA